ncbi:ATP-binding protein [Paenibacillus ehimensis]|uniref:ATP-binding protein n=1 Tax=Paenibacillus ehimensis TaxID=79264 RepID=UPI00046FA146|nr:ATP-binding protein [Paenibacillus ehimensis]
MRKMMFIGGIHGVGKTSLCKDLSNFFNIPHFSASKLISEEKAEVYSRNKLITDINTNQDFLSASLNRLSINGWFLLDGHFCLLNQESKITRIPFDTFRAISPKTIIVLTDSISSVQERFFQRDNYQFDYRLLQSFQREEVKYAEEVSSELGIPMITVQAGDITTIHRFIEEHTSQ